MKILTWLLIFSVITLYFPMRVDAGCPLIEQSKEQSWWEYTLEKNYYQYRRDNKLNQAGEKKDLENGAKARIKQIEESKNITHDGWVNTVRCTGVTKYKQLYENIAVYGGEYENTYDGNTVLVGWNNSKIHKPLLDGVWTSTGFECSKLEGNYKINGNDSDIKNPIICIGLGRK